jgi:hypothetical protein
VISDVAYESASFASFLHLAVPLSHRVPSPESSVPVCVSTAMRLGPLAVFACAFAVLAAASTLQLCAADGVPPVEQSTASSPRQPATLPPPLATISLRLTKTNGEAYDAQLALRAGHSVFSAALDFMAEHNVNSDELVGLANQLEDALQRAHPDAATHDALGVVRFPRYHGQEQRHAEAAMSLLHDGAFAEAAIHFGLAAHEQAAAATSSSTAAGSGAASGSGAEAEVTPEGSAIAAAAAAAAAKQQEYLESLSHILVLLGEKKRLPERAAALLAAGEWLPALQVLADAKAAGERECRSDAEHTRT